VGAVPVGAVTLALAGDTMLGRGVAERLENDTDPRSLFDPRIRELVADADLFLLNLECCVSSRGQPWPAPGKAFFFRAPPIAVETLTWLGVDCVTLANNHALDYGAEALLDTLDVLAGAGIATVGAGVDQAAARTPALLNRRGVEIAILGVTDHPDDFAAGPQTPGVAYATLPYGLPDWLREQVTGLRATADIVVVTPHWGPNMVPTPVPHVRAAGRALVSAGATVVAGHSAHVFHAVEGPVLYDLGDFIDDYAVQPLLRNDLGLLFLLTVDSAGPIRLEAVPLALDYCRTGPADGEDAGWVCDRFMRACARFGTWGHARDGHIVIEWR
jgi:poly-gamma-glutamate capsule biosynthesis protein CapA/YwtB (metallophosphatase superfamily)